MDEATASLDVENETLIQTALSRLIADKTVLVIAHRMRTVAGADKIVVLSDGTVAEEGSPRIWKKEWCICPYGKTADRKPELETCVKKEEAFGSHRRAAMMMLGSSRLLVGRK